MGVGGGGGGKWSNSPVWCVGGSLCDMNEGHTVFSIPISACWWVSYATTSVVRWQKQKKRVLYKG